MEINEDLLLLMLKEAYQDGMGAYIPSAHDGVDLIQDPQVLSQCDEYAQHALAYWKKQNAV